MSPSNWSLKHWGCNWSALGFQFRLDRLNQGELGPLGSWSNLAPSACSMPMVMNLSQLDQPQFPNLILLFQQSRS